jgi:hypothetical protein
MRLQCKGSGTDTQQEVQTEAGIFQETKNWRGVGDCETQGSSHGHKAEGFVKCVGSYYSP